MHNPRHPGEIVRHECIEPLGLTITRAAKGLGVSRKTLSDLVNERSRVSLEMAVRLSKAFGSTEETWLRLQIAYDLWQVRDRMKTIEVERFAEDQKSTANAHRESQAFRKPTEEERDKYRAGTDAAMRRAAIIARRRAIETNGSVPTQGNRILQSAENDCRRIVVIPLGQSCHISVKSQTR